MDQNNQVGSNNINTPQPLNDTMSSDYLVNQTVNPSVISTTQVQDDLDALKKAEEKIYSKSPVYIKKTKEVRATTLPSRPLTEIEILKIKNPFRGE